MAFHERIFHLSLVPYKCEDCDKVFEVIQKISEKKLTKCKCSKNGTVHRMVSSSGFRLKGSGWYETDFKTKKSDTKKTET